MVSKRAIKKRLSYASLDLRELKSHIDGNNWQGAMEWLNDLTGDIEVVREFLQERIDGMENDYDGLPGPR